MPIILLPITQDTLDGARSVVLQSTATAAAGLPLHAAEVAELGFASASIHDEGQ